MDGTGMVGMDAGRAVGDGGAGATRSDAVD
eukprot:COSAG02_NODE_62291_length_266_cov_0.622754_1_plen_29_part_01